MSTSRSAICSGVTMPPHSRNRKSIDGSFVSGVKSMPGKAGDPSGLRKSPLAAMLISRILASLRFDDEHRSFERQRDCAADRNRRIAGRGNFRFHELGETFDFDAIGIARSAIGEVAYRSIQMLSPHRPRGNDT